MREEGCNILHPWNLSSSGYFHFSALKIVKNESQHDKTHKMTCAPNKDADQTGHPPSLISPRCMLCRLLRTQALFMRTVKNLDQTDLSLRWVHRSFCWFCRFHYLKVRYTYSAEKCCGSNVKFSKHSYERIRTDFHSKNIQIFNKNMISEYSI